MRTLHRTLVRLAARMPALTLALALTLAAFGVWLASGDRGAIEAEARARAERAKLEEKRAEAQRRIEQLEVEIPPEQERVLRAEKVVAELRALTGTWQWIGGNREQQRLNRERLAKMEALHADAAARATALQQELRRVKWERDGYEIERERLEAEIRAEERKKTTATHRLRRIWLTARGWIVVAIAGYFAGPVWLNGLLCRWRERRAAAV